MQYFVIRKFQLKNTKYIREQQQNAFNGANSKQYCITENDLFE